MYLTLMNIIVHLMNKSLTTKVDTYDMKVGDEHSTSVTTARDAVK